MQKRFLVHLVLFNALIILGGVVFAQDDCLAVTRKGTIDNTGILHIDEQLPGDCTTEKLEATTQSVTQTATPKTQNNSISSDSSPITQNKFQYPFILQILTYTILLGIIYIVGSSLSPKREESINKKFIHFTSKHE